LPDVIAFLSVYSNATIASIAFYSEAIQSVLIECRYSKQTEIVLDVQARFPVQWNDTIASDFAAMHPNALTAIISDSKVSVDVFSHFPERLQCLQLLDPHFSMFELAGIQKMYRFTALQQLHLDWQKTGRTAEESAVDALAALPIRTLLLDLPIGITNNASMVSTCSNLLLKMASKLTSLQLSRSNPLMEAVEVDPIMQALLQCTLLERLKLNLNANSNLKADLALLKQLSKLTSISLESGTNEHLSDPPESNC